MCIPNLELFKGSQAYMKANSPYFPECIIAECGDEIRIGSFVRKKSENGLWYQILVFTAGYYRPEEMSEENSELDAIRIHMKSCYYQLIFGIVMPSLVDAHGVPAHQLDTLQIDEQERFERKIINPPKVKTVFYDKPKTS